MKKWNLHQDVEVTGDTTVDDIEVGGDATITGTTTLNAAVTMNECS